MNGTSAFVLWRVERREADWLTTLYTEGSGLIRAVAPGVRKQEAKLRGHLEPLTKTEVMIVHGRYGYRLTSAVLIEAYPRLHSSLDRTAVLQKAATVVARILFEERDTRLWRAMDEFFAALDTDKDLTATALAGGLYWFLARVLAELGYHPSHDSLFAETARLKSLFIAFETEPAEAALTYGLSRAACENIGRALEKAFQVHTGHDFPFISICDEKVTGNRL